MRRVLAMFVGLAAGYAAGAALGYLGITFFSANAHDKALEAAMTAAFVTGPAGALLGAVIAWRWMRPQ